MSDNRPTRIWIWLWIILLALGSKCDHRELRDAQRRIAVLEQRCQ